MRPSLLLLVSFLLLGLPFAAEVEGSALNDDVLGLIVFKAGVVDPESRLASWNEDDERPCSWAGVRCDPGTGRVAELSMDGFSLSGKLSRGLLLLQSLLTLSLPRNNFSGELPAGLLRLKGLRNLDLSENRLSGPIPSGFFAQCRSIRAISLARNAIVGEIPQDIASCSTLAALNLSSNQLRGSLPIGLWSLPALRSLDLSNNSLVGAVPAGLSRRYSLRTLILRGNLLAGELPQDIGDSLLLKWLDLSSNWLSGSLPESMRKLSSCSYLGLSSNSFSGGLPFWIGQMKSLEILDLSENNFSGEIPCSIGQLQLLKELRLSGNRFTGNVPSWVFTLAGLEKVSISHNMLTGSVQIPTVSTSPTARFLDLSSNDLSGMIPAEISALVGLLFLNLSSNSLSGAVPVSIGRLKSLQVLDLSANRLNGSIPLEIGAAASLMELSLERNSLTGEIPTQIQNCSSLASLDLSQNNLTGPIPPSMANLTGLQAVDLSQNKLTGAIPKQLSDLPHLLSFNISYNLLSGDIPAGSFFDTIPPSSLSDNPGLCGAAVNISCPAVLPKPIVLNPNSSSGPSLQPTLPSNDLHHKKIILSISALIAIGGAAAIAVGVITITVLNLRVRASESQTAAAALALSDDYLSQSPVTDANSGKLVMFGGADPEFSAGSHALLNKDCELGRGGFGTVYKTVLRDGDHVAIKKLTVSSLVKSRDDFEREVRLLGKVRHRNLVALKGYYWTSSLQLLMYEFVAGGNLHKHLHDHSYAKTLSWKERFDIILGAAKGLAHLHRHGITHYNLKSSNILLDGSGAVKVGDYGLAKLLPMLDRYVLSSKVQSALGYTAPEFACRTVKITEKCDVYGFGVLVLEILTGRRPVEYLEDDVVVLGDMVRAAAEGGRVEDCIDGRLCGKFLMEEVVPVMKLGLVCTSQVPSNRPDMREVVNMLQVIRCPEDSPGGDLV